MIIDSGDDCFRDDVKDKCVGLNRDDGNAKGGKKFRKRKSHDDTVPDEWDSHRKRDLAQTIRDNYCRVMSDIFDVDCFWNGA